MPMRIFKLLLIILIPDPAIINLKTYFTCHCEHLKGAWQSLIKGRDCFVSLAMTILICVFGLMVSVFSNSACAASDWKITLKVSGGGTYDYCVAGVKDRATDRHDNAWDIPAPLGNPYVYGKADDPPYIYTYFPHTETEWDSVFDRFRQDIRSHDLPKEWTFEVVSNISGKLTIEWPDLKNAIPDKEAVLVDIDGGGAEIDMHTSSSFVFVNSGSPRSFLVRISEVIPAPEPPQNLNGKLSQVGVILSWKRNSEPDLAGYNVYRSTISGSGYQKINYSLITGTKYIDKQIVKGKTYYYVVTAVNASGGESGYSNEVKVVTGK